MENFPPSFSYPDSGDSSPCSREIDFENPPPSWEDPTHQPPNPNSNPTPANKVKFMVSYGGKIQPRSHDNLLSYVAGDTKILSVDRYVKFPTFFSKLSIILGSDNDGGFGSGFSLKYQLPGEDLDALISVTNDDDLENMMHEYDRLSRGSSKPARLRLFLFPVQKPSSFESDRVDVEPDRFVEVLNSGSPPLPVNINNTPVDYLFGLENSPVPVPVPVQRVEPDQIHQAQVDARIQELNRMQISVQEMNRLKGDDGNGSLFPGAPASVSVGYWQPQQQPPPPQPQHQPVNIEQPPQAQMQQFQQQNMVPQFQQQQPVYMVHALGQGNVYHAPMMRGQASQGGGYYQQVYNVGPPGKVGYSEGMLYYAAPGPQPGGVVVSGAPSQGGGGGGVVVSGGGELRPVGVADPKVVQK